MQVEEEIMVPNIHEVTLENAQQILIEGSQEKLVVIDFFSQQHEASVRVSTALYNIAAQAQGKFTLAKVNVEQQPELVAHFGVQALPTVALFLNGQAVDGFAGEQSEVAIAELITQYLPSAEDEALSQALIYIEQNEYEQAYTLLTQSLNTAPERSDLKFSLIKTCFALGYYSQAKQWLDKIPLQDKNSEYQSLLAQYELAEQAASSPEIKALEEQIAKAPEDKDLLMQLALQYSQNDKKQQALELLFNKILVKDINYKDGEAKQYFIDIIATLPSGDPDAAKYRRQLYTLLY